MQKLKAGTTLQSGKFEIQGVLGQGGFGITYLAGHTLLDDTFAIKEFFPKEYCNRDDNTGHISVGTRSNIPFVSKLKDRFLKEARNLRSLDHPGIVKIHDIFIENDTAYYNMDFIEGKTLADIVKDGKALKEEDAERYIRQICDALGYMHEHRMNHFDLKPANIMVRKKDDRPVIIDFGLSKQYTDNDASGNSTVLMAVSRGYSAPEQYQEEGLNSFSPVTDVYSLGAILFFMLTGKTPPEAISLMTNPLEFPDNVSPRMREVIKGAMTPSRKKRFPNTEAFLRALGNAPEREEKKLVDRDETEILGKRDESETTVLSGTTASKKKSGGSSKGILFGAIGAAIVAIVVLLVWHPWTASPASPAADPEETAATAHNEESAGSETLPEGPRQVTDMDWESDLGKCVYTGPVTIIDGKEVPDGEGMARIVDGKLKGSVYTGNFKNGVMEGQTVYTTSNGDTFKGTFRNNRYEYGTYTIKATGEYFVGSFKDGQPSQGQWYNSKGLRI